MLRNRRIIASDRAIGWWNLYGSLPASTCVAAYRAVNADSLVASYTNLARPGFYNITPGATPPTWDSTGWAFTSANTRSLNITDLVPAAQYSTLVRFSNIALTSASTYGILFSAQSDASNTYHVWAGVNTGDTKAYWRNGGSCNATGYTSGVLGLVGQNAYANGSLLSAITDGTRSLSSFTIGRLNTLYLNGKIQAFAVYGVTLSSDIVAALTAAMNAL